MKSFSLSAICLIAGFIAASPAQAQCPGGLADPLYLINGSSWAFQTEDDFLGDGAVGIFSAQVQLPGGKNPYLTGILTLTMTTNNQGVITVRQSAVGKYQIYPDCSGGQLFFNANQNSYQYAFVFVSGRTEMYLTSNSNDVPNTGFGPFAGNHGKAILTPETGCPAGLSDPLFLLNGTTWSFQAQDPLSSSVGIFQAQVQLPGGKNPYLTGVLSITATTAAVGTVYNQQMYPGRYQIYSDCSGGELLFNTNFNAYQYSFVFAGNGARIFMVSNAVIPPPANVPGGNTLGNRGEAKQF